MKKIYFIRHAKAVDEGRDKDRARELSNKGKEDAKFMALRLLKLDVKPDVIFSSDAKRCEQTAKRFGEILKFKGKVALKSELYEPNLDEFLKFIQSIDDKFNEIFIISHNPTITKICEFLSDSSIDNIPTGGIFCLEVGCFFKDIKEGCARALFFDYPKKYQK